MLLWGVAYWSERLEDKHINVNHKELLLVKHKKALHARVLKLNLREV